MQFNFDIVSSYIYFQLQNICSLPNYEKSK